MKQPYSYRYSTPNLSWPDLYEYSCTLLNSTEQESIPAYIACAGILEQYEG